MNILITGVNGFVGRHLLKCIPTYFNNKDINIFGTYYGKLNNENDFNEIELFSVDIRNKEEITKMISYTKPDYVIHLAAQSSAAISWKNPTMTIDINVNGTVNLLDSIKEYNKNTKILVVGSSDEYGIVNTPCVNEKSPLNPKNPYAISKVTQELVSKLYVDAYNMDIVMTRSFNHIGPLQEPIFVVADWAKQIAEIENGLKKPMISVGDITVERDFADVRDVVRAYLDLLVNGIAGEIYNVGSGKTYKLERILNLLISYSKVKIDVDIDQSKIRPIENKVILCDRKKIEQQCGWTPKYDIEQTLLDILNYWREKITNNQGDAE